MRGTVRFNGRPTITVRITPACAGNSIRLLQLQAGQEDHPRVCGEQAYSSSSSPPAAGSPPRVRGTVSYIVITWKSRRITPACAGNSWRRIYGWESSWDHPRVCGEQHGAQRFCGYHRGSPPRVRGTGGIVAIKAQLYRITPACAGNRGYIYKTTSPTWDHPRVCGEQWPNLRS